MSASARRSALAAAAGVLSGSLNAWGGAQLEVSGSVLSTAPRLEIRVGLDNRGDAPATPVEVVAELLGQTREARLLTGVPPGGSGSVVLEFDPGEARPGVYALTLLIEHPVAGAPDGAGNPPLASRRAWLLVALGGGAEPAVRLRPGSLRLEVEGRLPVSLESADGAPHEVRLRGLAARGLRFEDRTALVEVPARGPAETSLSLMRAGAARGSGHAVLLVAETVNEPVVRTAVASAAVEVAADPSLFRRRRTGVFVVGGALLAAALAIEAWRRVRRLLTLT